jgi:two-component system nitrogen regulation response regulator GlnG
VLSDGHFYRVGGHQPLKANVRVIAATHQNLEERVRQGLFREDLFHRLNVIRLRLPALRERGQDVPLLARHFLARSARELGVEPKRLSDAALARLASFAWPGNVRQLENVCHWLTVMAPAQTVEPKDLPPEVQAAVPPVDPRASGMHAGAPNGATVAPFGPESSPSLTGAPGASPPGHGAPASPPAFPYEPISESGAAGFGGSATGGLPGAGPLRGYPGSDFTDPVRESGQPPRMLPPSGAQPVPVPVRAAWANLLEPEVAQLLSAQSARGGEPPSASDVMDQLTRTFESTIIRTALRHTRGRRIDAALRLGIGRNTITRKIQDLRLEDD